MSLLRLNSNEGPRASRALLTELADLDPELLRRYPDAAAVEAALAARVGVSEDRILVTAGADEALDRLYRAYAGPRSAGAAARADLRHVGALRCARRCPARARAVAHGCVSARRDPLAARRPHRNRGRRLAEQSDRRRRITG